MSSSPESQSPSSPDSPRHLAWPVPPVPITVTHYNTHTRQHTTSTTTTTTTTTTSPTAGPSPTGGPTMIKSRRFYSSPLSDTSSTPDPKTPLQAYGLEQREPSIAEEKPHLLRRVSHALDDIKEDFSLGLDARGTAEKIRSRRRGSVFFEAPPSSSLAPRPESARPLSIFSTAGSVDHGSGSAGKRISRRLSMFGGGFSQRRKRVGESISQPNLIGSSTHL
ncbi:hypothetical protein SI65_09804 [Aspergillus cristatus]|uniref:Uncharacterized protein n=1 Tax=Aspergillus cristatus TaxID=573508 RepID=A0A1E3B1I0_ASPCR|nr:hypothetical protein SI65_09804 [Aspergillus cristatus]